MRSIQLGLMLAALTGVGAAGATRSDAVPAPAATAPLVATLPPPAWLQRDPADSLYRAAREALTRGRYQQAGDLFRQLVSRYPDSGYAPDALYWEAFALYRTGGSSNLRRALDALREQERRYPAAKNPDAPTLATRIRGELARMGDAESAAVVAEQADLVAPSAPVAPPVPDAPVVASVNVTGEPPAMPARPPRAPRAPRAHVTVRDDQCADEDETKTAALNALLQMDADRAVPILQKVLARRDSASVCLRRRAVFLLSQKDTPETGRMLLDVVRNDPDAEVRGQAVFWLSQVQGEAAVAALDSILRSSKDQEIQGKALFALSQQSSPRATAALRSFAQREDVPDEVRANAIFWLGQRGTAEDATFLRQLYGRTQSTEMKKRILFSVSQMGRGAETTDWLVSVARNSKEDLEQRKQALFWAGQGGAPTKAVADLYDTMPDEEMKQQVIFVLSQRKDAAAVDKLIDIAKTEKDPELRKRALFWLGQSNDPRVTQILEDVLTKP